MKDEDEVVDRDVLMDLPELVEWDTRFFVRSWRVSFRMRSIVSPDTAQRARRSRRGRARG